MYKNIIVVTNRHLVKKDFLEQIKLVCKKKPKAIILREKDLSEEDYEKLAKEVIKICNEYNVKCILHFYINVAKKLGQSSIHLPLYLLKENKDKVKDFKEIGVSIHSLDEASEAQSLGATYLCAGHIFSTDCKKGVKPRGEDFLKEIILHSLIPVFAIGGIDFKNIKNILDLGAAGGAIMSLAMNDSI